MDEFLAQALRTMNSMDTGELSSLSTRFRRGLQHNFTLFDRHAFRKHLPGQEKRRPLNASLWDVLSTGMSKYEELHVEARTEEIRSALYDLLDNEDFNTAITYGPNDARKVRMRFEMLRNSLREMLG